jgi:iron complex outermembrane receptor protein
VTHGFGEDYARRMQVLVDGRSVFLPTIGGVRWDALPLDIEDIERIEVARGPNAATYGANAFTGIINIITRHVADVPDNTLAIKAGRKGLFETYVRHAGGEGDSRYLFTLSHQESDGYDLQADTVRAPSATMRWETRPSSRDSLSLRAGYKGGTRQNGEINNPGENWPRDQSVDSHFQQLEWQRELDTMSSMELRLSHGHMRQSELYPPTAPAPYLPISVLLQLSGDRWDAEMEYKTQLAAELRAVAGLSLRHDAVWSPQYFGQTDHLRTDSQSLFGHLEWRPVSDWLVNAGLMLEYHDIGGRRASPRLSVHWQPHAYHSLRLGASRAYRNPLQFEENLDLRDPRIPVPALQQIYKSSGGLEPEEVTATDLGYLGQWPELDLSLDLRMFRDHYRSLVTSTRYSLGVPVDYRNTDEATLEGLDGQLQWHPRPDTRLILNFARTVGRGTDTAGRGMFSDATPTYLYGLLATHRLPAQVDVSLGYYQTGRVQVIGTGQGLLPKAERLDVRIGKDFQWARARCNLALVLQNILHPYQEYDEEIYNRFDRRGYVSLMAEF